MAAREGSDSRDPRGGVSRFRACCEFIAESCDNSAADIARCSAPVTPCSAKLWAPVSTKKSKKPKGVEGLHGNGRKKGGRIVVGGAPPRGTAPPRTSRGRSRRAARH